MTNACTACLRWGTTLLVVGLLAAITATAAPAQTNKTLVDVNSANLATLESLPGIGPTLAQRIIDGRPYKGPEDLEKVKGLTKSKVTALKGQVAFGPTATTRTAPATTVAAGAATKSAVSTNAAAAKQTATKAGSTAKSTDLTTAPDTANSKAPTAGAKATSAKSNGKLTPGQKVNINKASYQELDALPGIGSTKAQAIIDYRTQKGPFKTIEDIQNVKGIKAGSFSKIKDYIKVSD